MANRALRKKIEVALSTLPISLLNLRADEQHLMPYIQHIPRKVEYAQDQFLKLCDDVMGTRLSYTKVDRQGNIGRIIDESRHRFPFSDDLYTHWYRFMCIDDHYREWCQPY